MLPVTFYFVQCLHDSSFPSVLFSVLLYDDVFCGFLKVIWLKKFFLNEFKKMSSLGTSLFSLTGLGFLWCYWYDCIYFCHLWFSIYNAVLFLCFCFFLLLFSFLLLVPPAFLYSFFFHWCGNFLVAFTLKLKKELSWGSLKVSGIFHS